MEVYVIVDVFSATLALHYAARFLHKYLLQVQQLLGHPGYRNGRRVLGATGEAYSCMTPRYQFRLRFSRCTNKDVSFVDTTGSLNVAEQ